jgi:CubicO group peptidase (beta-lactamase class C family)
MKYQSMWKVVLIGLVIQLCFVAVPVFSANINSNIESKVDHYINAYVKLHEFSGSILIAQKGRDIVNKGYGMADREHGIRNSPETVFRIASLTKQFTAMAIMMLEEKGLLDLDDSLTKYIPDYPGGDKIKIFHLLTHTSGIPDHTELPGFDKERRVYPYDITKTIETFKNKPLEFAPGEKFKYCNSGYILLGYIIEKVTGMPYGDYIKQNIFEPLKMSHSGFESTYKIVKNHANGYRIENNEFVKAKYRNISNASASGALYSTTEDLYLWDRALYTEKLIKKSSLEKMFSPFRQHYGYGWGIVNVFNRKMVGHNGETEGFRANISRFINDDACIIILSNLEETPVGKISIGLAAILFGEKYDTPEMKKFVKVDPDLLNEYVGKYELNPKFYFVITGDNTHLYCQANAQKKLEIYPVSEKKFYVQEVDAYISFERGKNNKIERLILHQGGKERAARKIN